VHRLLHHTKDQQFSDWKRIGDCEARTDLIRANLPKSDTKALEGKLSVDDKFAFPSQILAYKAVRAILGEVCRDLSARRVAKTLLVFTEKDLNAIGNLPPNSSLPRLSIETIRNPARNQKTDIALPVAVLSRRSLQHSCDP